ncbi:na+-driven multidrug efflux pump [Stylonychia lemnae]|uniref:Na+-driven multidrug efflux pump n=1 Tax=Stylonychia lemnae TaxID=5949 RepID=A0A078A3H9_STYLE|nr:na+-driven multidrug efflux pump [Stylonychia lemnae]|eukprot:CDW76352.1 na+-driven multidrug efflux pump [Stylonychia lemnae]
MGIWSWWAFDIFTFIASMLSTDELAAQTICRNIGLIFYMIPLSVGQASSTLVGNSIGAQDIPMAKGYIRISVITGLVWGVISVVLMLLFQQQIILAFSQSPAVITQMNRAFEILSFYVFLDCIQQTAVGIIGGIGKQSQSSSITLIGFWLVGIPVALILVFYLDSGLFGLWLAMSLALIYVSIFYFVLIKRADFKEIALKAYIRKIKDKGN